jgi:hypothetical protein
MGQFFTVYCASAPRCGSLNIFLRNVMKMPWGVYSSELTCEVY